MKVGAALTMVGVAASQGLPYNFVSPYSTPAAVAPRVYSNTPYYSQPAGRMYNPYAMATHAVQYAAPAVQYAAPAVQYAAPVQAAPFRANTQTAKRAMEYVATGEMPVERTAKRGLDIGMLMLMGIMNDSEETVFGMDSSDMMVPIAANVFAQSRPNPEGTRRVPSLQDFMLARMAVGKQDDDDDLFDDILPFLMANPAASGSEGNNAMGVYMMLLNDDDSGKVNEETLRPWMVTQMVMNGEAGFPLGLL